ncbi:uncharacterized protein K452DRAFT_355178 [Aplosporella prunicola CBS 121167]|uniref:Major facilitator superfamily (MFS) profile domain-containing protein n=1 Tax=Aplosporella prunicola CBS 121167 TaxID=1176127 RepID=A0A6A6BRJ8_9PEZI|nr:uncharacterized protein K452DRAFT_355178 [Aplosporella prunicola CBS 121167]KAF2146716.1 hypothetical protein K452DRAFT_355178 [Aplosporella prunicola CBS 121167]
MRHDEYDERSPLLENGHAEYGPDHREEITLSKEDNPRAWPRRKKLANVAVIAAMAVTSPLASSMFTPGMDEIAEGLHTDPAVVVGATTGFVIALGIGPLVLAPLSETFGRRRLYLTCFTIFSLLQVPCALSPNIQTLLAMRTLSGFFGSVGIANGGGTIGDMFEKEERAGVFGWYLLGPLLGPSLGPLLGGVIVRRLGWRYIFWILTAICGVNTLGGFIFLKETYAPVLLDNKRKERIRENPHDDTEYWIEGEDTRPLWKRLAYSLSRPGRIFTHPIVFTMSLYQAVIFSTTYSLYTNFQDVYGDKYGFNTEQIGLLYLSPGLGYLFAVRLLVPKIDVIYKKLKARNNGVGKPEFRLPLANIGSVFIPVSLFWFAWTVQAHTHWVASTISTFFYGIGQVMITNPVQNYYIDTFEQYAASAIAAGAVFRSVVGGIVPLFAPALFKEVGYGWGISTFALISCALAPAPILFYWYGEKIRESFTVHL